VSFHLALSLTQRILGFGVDEREADRRTQSRSVSGATALKNGTNLATGLESIVRDLGRQGEGDDAGPEADQVVERLVRRKGASSADSCDD
jgi:hypothetical protein